MTPTKQSLAETPTKKSLAEKKVFIVSSTPENELKKTALVKAIKADGGNVIFSQYSPRHSSNAANIITEIQTNQPDIILAIDPFEYIKDAGYDGDEPNESVTKAIAGLFDTIKRNAQQIPCFIVDTQDDTFPSRHSFTEKGVNCFANAAPEIIVLKMVNALPQREEIASARIQ